jgi:hypothetical protein
MKLSRRGKRAIAHAVIVIAPSVYFAYFLPYLLAWLYPEVVPWLAIRVAFAVSMIFALGCNELAGALLDELDKFFGEKS